MGGCISLESGAKGYNLLLQSRSGSRSSWGWPQHCHHQPSHHAFLSPRDLKLINYPVLTVWVIVVITHKSQQLLWEMWETPVHRNFTVDGGIPASGRASPQLFDVSLEIKSFQICAGPEAGGFKCCQCHEGGQEMKYSCLEPSVRHHQNGAGTWF